MGVASDLLCAWGSNQSPVSLEERGANRLRQKRKRGILRETSPPCMLLNNNGKLHIG